MTGPRILVVRNDKLGDFMLAWPALALLKRSLPQAHISVLVPSYTAPLAHCCPWVDSVLIDPTDLGQIDRQSFDAVLTLFSTGRIGWKLFTARIPLRLAPATKFAQIFYTHRVRQRRSQSAKPEYVYNLELAEALLRLLGAPAASSEAPFWPMPQSERDRLRQGLAEQLNIDPARPWFFVHSGSGGSANNLSLRQYADLIHATQSAYVQGFDGQSPQWVLTAGPGEEQQAASLLEACAGVVDAVLYRSTQGLATFARNIATAQLMIAGSTGPLHVAGALDVPTVGFFPAKRSSTPLRWRPCNSEGRTLGFSPERDGSDDLSSIDPRACAERIVAWYRG